VAGFIGVIARALRTAQTCGVSDGIAAGPVSGLVGRAAELQRTSELAAELSSGQGHVLLSLAELHLAKGEHEQAADRIEAAKKLTSELGEQASLALAHQFGGQLAEAAGDRDLADREFGVALDLLRPLDQPARVASCHAAYAEILEGRGDTRLALQHMKQALHTSRGGVQEWEGESLRTAGPA